MQGKRTRVLDSRGRPVSGLCTRDGRYIAGFNCPQSGKWRMVTLDADTLTEARRERDSLIAGLREGRTPTPGHGDLRRPVRRLPGRAEPLGAHRHPPP